MSIRYLIVFLVTGYAISGCTIVGSVVGMGVDFRKPKIFSINSTIEINQDTPIEVITILYDTIRGNYNGVISNTPLSLRESFYRAKRDLPDIFKDSHTVYITLSNEKIWKGTVLGFDAGTIKFQLEHKGNISSSEIPVDWIKFISGENGHRVLGDTLKYWMQNGLIPSQSSILISTNNYTKMSLPLLGVRRIIEIKPTTYYSIIFGLIGLAIDVIIFVNQPWTVTVNQKI